jgi:hypothetical protein
VTAWRLLKLCAALTLLGVVTAGGFLLWPLVWPDDPDASTALVEGRLVGETEGYVLRIELDRYRIHVTSSLFGLAAVPIAIAPDTRIVVGEKLGGFGDIWKGMDVRVSYELRGGLRIARSVDVLSARSRVGGPGSADIVVPASAAVEAASGPIVLPAAAEKAGAPLLGPPRRGAGPAPTRAPERAEPAAGPRPSAESDPRDGTAAVDWLIGGARR